MTFFPFILMDVPPGNGPRCTRRSRRCASMRRPLRGHGQKVDRLAFKHMAGAPERLYGVGLASK